MWTCLAIIAGLCIGIAILIILAGMWQDADMTVGRIIRTELHRS